MVEDKLVRELSVDLGVLDREVLEYVDREREERCKSSCKGRLELSSVIVPARFVCSPTEILA